ncbi:MAG: 50S ribosomal protein L9 [Chlamydiota bacterium]
MKKKRMQEGLLLLEDVVNLGRKGDIVRAKPGFAWNFLLPQKRAVLADKRTVRLQEQLKAERAKQAAEDEKQARAVASRLKGKMFVAVVKTDSSGHLYGSVTAVDIVKVLDQEADIAIDRRSVLLPRPIKKTGVHTIRLSLKEGVPAEFKLKVKGESEIETPPTQIEVVEEDAAAKGAAELTPGEEVPSDTDQKTAASEELKTRTKNEETP